MDLLENRTNHPNVIVSAQANECTIGQQQFTSSIIIPFDGEVTTTPLRHVSELKADVFAQLCSYQPEVIVLATGEHITFPDPDQLDALIKNNVGLEVLSNQAAARTFNVLLSENRQVVCLMLID